MGSQKYNNTVIAILTTLDEKLANYGYAISLYFKNTGSPCSHQQVYRELRHLEKSGLVSRKDEPIAGKPDRGIYTITAKGRQFLLTAKPDTLSKITAFDLALCFKKRRFVDWALDELEADIVFINKNIDDKVIRESRLMVIDTQMYILNEIYVN